MRKSLALLFALLLVVPLVAQQRTGNIFGKVADTEGNALPGVSVTLTGQYTAPLATISSAEGAFRFLSLPASKDYKVKLELAGFKTKFEENIIVNVGVNTNLTLTMEMGVLEEQVTVTAVSPIVDTKKTSVGTNVTQDILQGLPTARDPWVILQMAPSVIVDRENVGGAESGQQSNYVARGAGNYDNNVWAMDGVVITDPAAIGASPSYYDFDAFEEMTITVGGSDVTVQTGGVALNMVTRRGGNKVSLGGRFYLTDSKFQAQNLEEVDEIRAREPGLIGVNYINNNKDYGFNLGLPILKDKIWFWGSYGVQDIKTTTVYGTKDDTLLENFAGKLNIQIIPENRFEAFVHIGGKKKWGRSASASLPDGYAQQGRYHFGSPIIKFQDEHMFGDNLFVSLKYAFSDAGFSLTPMMDLDFNDTPIWDEAANRWYGGQWRYFVKRPVNQYNALLNYFNDSLLGASHDIKLGVEYADRNQYSESVYSGNMTITQNFIYEQADFNGDGFPDVPTDPNFKNLKFCRGYYMGGPMYQTGFTDQSIKALAGYFSDTVTFGRFNLLLGLRFDYQTPRINPINVTAMDGGPAWDNYVNEQTQTKLDALLPGLDIPKIEATDMDGNTYAWQVFSPRLGFTWDMTGDGKTIAKLSLSMYGDFMGTGEAGRWVPGGAQGWLNFYWWDNGDGVVDWRELYWYGVNVNSYQLYRVYDDGGNFVGDWTDAQDWFWGSYDPNNPTTLRDPYQSIRSNAGSVRTSEAMVTLEREIFTDFAISVVGSYRRIDNFRWTLKYWPQADGSRLYEDQTMWFSAGNPITPGFDPKDAGNHEWFYANTQYTTPTNYSEVQRRPDYYQDYFGVDVLFNKRLSNKWMLNANFTWQAQAQNYGDKGYMNPTNIWALDGQPYAAYIGGASGKINQHVYTRWMGKIGGLYQFPFDINLGVNFQVREGWPLPETFTYVNYTLPNPRSRSATLNMGLWGDAQRLPTFYNLSLRLEKMIKAGDTGRIYIMADVFNALNKMIENRRYMRAYGTYSYYGADDSRNKLVATPTFNALNEVLNPRVLRLGVRFTF